MARIVEQERKRGRKKGALRTTAMALAAQVKGTKGTREDTLSLREPSGNKGDKGESATFIVPKGAVAVPMALTAGKTDENVRTTIANAAKDAGVEVKVASAAIALEQDADGKAIPVEAQEAVPVFWLLDPNDTTGISAKS